MAPKAPTAGVLEIIGAAQNNLAGVDLEIPKGELVAITGVSGSGKSSLAFDTLFREGQRRFLETLSAYARQFLGGLHRPNVERIEGLSPAIAVDQKSLARGARSTVGTLTEIVDHLRVVFARAGRAHCPECDLPVESQTPEAIVQRVRDAFTGERIHLLAPVVRGRKGHHRAVLDDLRKKGFVRVRVDGEVQRIEDVSELERYVRHSIEVVVDRLRLSDKELSRLRDAVDQALEVGDGDLLVLGPAREGDEGGSGEGEREERFSTQRTCPGCGTETPPLEPRLFSFNSPHGACADCDGLGLLRRPSATAVVRDSELSIREGALAVTRASGGALLFPRCDFEFLERVGAARGFDLDTPWKELPAKARKVMLHGAGQERFEDRSSWNGERFKGSVRWQRKYRGVLPALERALERGSRRKLVQRFLSEQPCDVCEGTRLRAPARAVRLGATRLEELVASPVNALLERLDGIEAGLPDRERKIAYDLLNEVRRRTRFLVDVGLGYLTLDRPADSLSGGEAQRIRLAAQLGAGLQGVLYVLDEPSIGLHARDHGRLLGSLEELCDLGNSVVVVEHDEATLRAADWLVEIGPGAGRHGGHVVAEGPPAKVAQQDTATGALLRGELLLERPEERRAGTGDSIGIRGARAFNLAGVDVDFPLGTLTAVTGVSGSGKSTLVDRILRRALERHMGREAADPAPHDELLGLEAVDEFVCVDASPIGRTPRSNPATYTGVFGPIRDLFAGLPVARMRGYTKSRFSFNVAGGRCEECSGAGAKLVELQFLAPVTVACDECGGQRFQAETLDVQYHGHSIADVLSMTVEDAFELFRDHPRIAHVLSLMVDIGLGYLTLGQPSTTLSGGEAQRIKLALHLKKRPGQHTVYFLDEPTTGLHQKDVGRLVAALQRLVDRGHTVIVIEHNLDVIEASDHVVDLGPDGGAGGGHVVFTGTPEALLEYADSATGRALVEHLDSRRAPDRSRAKKSRLAGSKRERKAAPDALTVRGARTHNLQEVDVTVPRNSLTVVTGPSGSGKSSLALDTIHTEGRRRFVESLSTYARQFLGTQERPPVEQIEGLGPSVAVEAGTVRAHPRSTVATTTEIHDHVRVLWARAGTPRCPDHGTKLERGDASKVARRVIKDFDGERGWIVAPILGPGCEEQEDPNAFLVDRAVSWTKEGFARILVDGKEHRLDGSLPELEPPAEEGEGTRLDLVIDRLAFSSDARARIAEAVEGAENHAGGRISVIAKPKSGARGEPRRLEYSTRGACPECGFHLDGELEPRHFSFNTHVGACPGCDGLGQRVQCVEELLVAHPDKPLRDAIEGKLGRYLTKGKGFYENLLRTVAERHGIDLTKPWEKLGSAQRALIAYGKGARQKYEVSFERHTTHADVEESFVSDWPGLCGHVDAWHQKTEDPEWAGLLESVMERQTCSLCEGERLAPGPRAVTLGRKRLPEILSETVGAAVAWLEKLRLPAATREATEPVVAELEGRLALLRRVGLSYLTLDRATATLSGGEARRVRLASSLGSKLSGVCYVLDEPTVGLHPRDVAQLTDTLCELRDRGNTVLVVEHDLTLMERADWVVDMGPGAGRHGGRVVVSGTPAKVKASKRSLTGRALRGELDLEPARARARAKNAADEEAETTHSRSRPGRVMLHGARHHNLQGVDFGFEFGCITGLCGPSGSGKSTLILDVLVPALSGERPRGRWKKLTGARGGGLRTVVVDAAPLGRTPKSLPATYVGLMDPLRELFARTPDARVRGFGAGHFSFNSSKGRCPACEGRGAELVEMQFLADLWLTCEECDGRRYKPEVLGVKFRGKSIADVLELSVEEACEFFQHQPALMPTLQALLDVGLGYMQLGQSSTTLSGGEAQRVKLASELHRARSGGPCVVVLDEPSTGLSASDLVHLGRVFEELAARSCAVLLIEHHTGLLALCDRLVELGPDGGVLGGRLMGEGTPAELAADPDSITGPYLAESLARAEVPVKARKKAKTTAKSQAKPARRTKATKGSSEDKRGSGGRAKGVLS